MWHELRVVLHNRENTLISQAVQAFARDEHEYSENVANNWESLVEAVEEMPYEWNRVAASELAWLLDLINISTKHFNTTDHWIKNWTEVVLWAIDAQWLMQVYIIWDMASTILQRTFLQSRKHASSSLRKCRRQLNTAAGYHGSQNSVNADEIAHFSKLSSQWWDERGEFSFLHQMNPVRMQFIRDKLYEVAQEDISDGFVRPTQVLQGLDVLDVGCGGGLLSEVRRRCISTFHSVTCWLMVSS